MTFSLPSRSMDDGRVPCEPARRGLPNTCTCGQEREYGCEYCHQSLCDRCSRINQNGESVCDVCILRCPNCDGYGLHGGPQRPGRSVRGVVMCRKCGGTGRRLTWWHHYCTARTFRWLAEAGQHPKDCDCEFCGALKLEAQITSTERSASPSQGRSVDYSGVAPHPGS